MSVTLLRPEGVDVPIERYQLGEITDAAQLDPAMLDIGAELAPREIYAVTVRDPYVEQYSSEERAEVAQVEHEADDFARARREAGKWERRAETVYFDEHNVRQTKRGWGDPVSRDRFFNKTLGSPAINAWRTKIPSAEALADLSDPLNSAAVIDTKGNMVAVDETARTWLTLCTDAVAIRSRATVMANVVRQFVDEQRALNENQGLEDLRWMSVACGTALPAMKAALHAGARPEMLLVDLDKNALHATRKMAAEIGFEGQMSQRDDVNIFLPSEMARLREELGDNGDRPMLIDLMGIFEYTGDNLGVDPVEFLRSNYDMLHPGGRLVFGQMRDDRPVPDFTMGVVSWPYVEMRSPRQFMEIVKQAGIPVETTTLYLPDDGVYTVGVIDKPPVVE